VSFLRSSLYQTQEAYKAVTFVASNLVLKMSHRQNAQSKRDPHMPDATDQSIILLFVSVDDVDTTTFSFHVDCATQSRYISKELEE
jgi:hypothetical protein